MVHFIGIDTAEPEFSRLRMRCVSNAPCLLLAQKYGPAVRRKSVRRTGGERSCINAFEFFGTVFTASSTRGHHCPGRPDDPNTHL